MRSFLTQDIGKLAEVSSTSVIHTYYFRETIKKGIKVWNFDWWKICTLSFFFLEGITLDS